MESLTQFFNDVGRIAAALETLAFLHGADPAERVNAFHPAHGAPYRGDSAATQAGEAERENLVVTLAAGYGGGPAFAAAQAGEAERQKRKRRTKAEIAADEAAKAAAESAPMPSAFPAFSIPAHVDSHGRPHAAPLPVVPTPVVPTPVVPTPVVPTPVVPTPVVPTPVVPAPVVPAPVVPAPVVPAQPDMSGYAAQYAALTVPQQFSALLDVYGKYSNVMGVVDALQRSLGALGLAGEKLSDMLDSSLPGDNYKKLDNAQRWSIYQQVFSAATAAAHTM